MKDNVITTEDINKAIEDLKRGPTSRFTAEDVKEFMDRHEKLMRDGINDFPDFVVYPGKKDFSGIKIDTDRLKPRKGNGRWKRCVRFCLGEKATEENGLKASISKMR